MSMHIDYTLLTDLYQLTMAQGYFQMGKTKNEACFHMFFRECPFEGGYAIACGTAQLAQVIDSFRFTDDHIAYLASLDAPGGGKLFDAGFLEYLANYELSCDIDAVPEGTVVFPYEPLVRVKGPIIECQILETAFLNCVNFQTLIATKASRICQAAAGRPVAEFGLRRAQGEAGGIWASRAAYVGGCASTSNVLAGKLFDIPVSGTHAHSWVMSFESELDAFRAYAQAFPTNCVLLVDTYDVRQGIENAIIVGHEMREHGHRLAGVRIDSGDLAWAARLARSMLDEAGLFDCGVVLSNDLDEYSVQAILDEGTPVSSWGIGTKLATAYDQPALGGVYKLSAIRCDKGKPWHDCLKVSESTAKLTIPGILDVRRYRRMDGRYAGDMIYDVKSGIRGCETIVDPVDELRRKNLEGLAYTTLLKPLARNGRCLLANEDASARVARERALEQLSFLDESNRRIFNPYAYPVGLEFGLWQRRKDMAAKLRVNDQMSRLPQNAVSQSCLSLQGA